MSDVPLSQVIEGSLGFFWPFTKKVPRLNGDPERGYVRRDGGWLLIETLDENVKKKYSQRKAEGAPEAIAALMPEKSALLLEVVGSGWTTRSGYRASSKRYRARTIIGDIPFDRLKSARVTGVEARFHGVSDWAGVSAAKESMTPGDDGRPKSWTLTLSATEAQNHKISHGREVVLSTTWRVDGDQDRRIASAPVTLACSSKRPRDIWDLLQPMLFVQDLLSLAWEGFVAAADGAADLHLSSADRGETSRPRLWNGALMVPLPGVAGPKSANEYPLFDLADLGGVPGLARWIRLCDGHPRAVGPVVNPYRFGPATAEVALKDVASGIEYWVKSNRPAAWANGKYMQALAGRVGNSFNAWVGNTEDWCRDFWNTYNMLKHEITYRVDPERVSDLVHSGRFLLAAALLNRVAGTKGPSRQIFRSHRTHSLGLRLRKRYH
ncbi:HEPN domain-containing protein [Nonomuraea polychroma]|uniref:ApeA N-terminal domain 1-containing protein n=1 Tax=Nonomuraea polychroma TaxID=46176 RepID=UPI003D8DB786